MRGNIAPDSGVAKPAAIDEEVHILKEKQFALMVKMKL